MWLIFALSAVLVWGVWGYLSKIVVGDIGGIPGLIILGVAGGFFAFVILLFHGLPSVLPNLPLYIFTGLLGGLGTLLFYLALEKGNASTVIPISAQYIVVAALLAFIFLKEPVTARKIFGIIFAVSAIVLLSG